MQAVCGNWRVWGAAAVVLFAAEPARAFYWQNWPGSRVPINNSLLSPPDGVTIGNPPSGSGSSGPVSPPTPPVGPPLPVDKPPLSPPDNTPEPATGLLGLLGLGAVAAARKWRRKN
jgi:MYXO-CTERM domain-containing protein